MSLATLFWLNKLWQHELSSCIDAVEEILECQSAFKPEMCMARAA